MNRRCGSSKPTPTPLNGLAIKPGKTQEKAIEGNADTTIRQTTRQKPAACRQRGGGARRKRRYGKATTFKTLPRTVSVAGGRDEERRIEEHALRQGKPTSNPSRRLPSWRLDETKKAKTNTKMERWHNLQSREGGGSA